MMGIGIKVRDGLGRFFGGLGRRLSGLADEAVELDGGPRDEAELALYQAMGWDEPGGRDAAAAVAAGKFRESLNV